MLQERWADSLLSNASSIEVVSVADEIDEVRLAQLYGEPQELYPSTFEAKAGSILHGLGFSQQPVMQNPAKDMFRGWRMRVAS